MRGQDTPLDEIIESVLAGKPGKEFLNPCLQGRSSAERYLQNIIIPPHVEGVQRQAFGFTELAEQGLYSPDGLFEQVVDFTGESMPLVPQMLSPYFGKIVATLLTTAYLASRTSAQATFLGLGAGRGYLDVDVIEDIIEGKTRERCVPKGRRVVKSLEDWAEFIVSDRTERSVGYLRQAVSHLPASRVSVERINALDFDLGKKPYGLVYANEILDNLPVEPIVLLQGELYKVMLIAHTPCEVGKERQWTVGQSLEGLSGTPVVKAEALAMPREDVRYLPVFVPLHYDSPLQGDVLASHAAHNITKKEYNGLYPFQRGLKGLFSSIRNSFQHGAVLLIDYTSFGDGQHNWNVAVNQFPFDYRLGEEDIDFQIDFEQVQEEAAAQGMTPFFLERQDKVLHGFRRIRGLFGPREWERWHSINTTLPKGREVQEAYALHQMVMGNMPTHQHYCVLGLSF